MFKAIDKWLPGYLRSVFSRPRKAKGPRHLIVALCDHFEPFRDGVDAVTARQTVRDWLAAYPDSVDTFRDADGHPPRHTFFYPQEEYDEAILDDLTAFCRKGYGEVEIHLHHRHDTPEGFLAKLESFRDLLHEKHGLLGEEITDPCEAPVAADVSAAAGRQERECVRRDVERHLGETAADEPRSNVSFRTRYAFIHGNWALCNARPDGDWCGVNEELGILAATGCYADFTFPSAPSPTQPRMVNAIYYARDFQGRPRGADRGVRVQTKGPRPQATDPQVAADVPAAAGRITGECVRRDVERHHGEKIQGIFSSLLLITGPLALNWCRRKWGILPRLENAEISGANPPTADRIRLWARQQIQVEGRPDWTFVKLHTHGCMPANQAVLLGAAMREAHAFLQKEFNDGQNWQLHYVTAREMANLVKAAEANLPGSPGQYRDYRVGPPSFRSR